MIILTDKAEYDFGRWLFERRVSIEEFKSFHKLSETAQYAIFIEWFDSVGIYIEVGGIIGYKVQFHYNILEIKKEVKPYGRKFEKRIEATKEAIILSNELYNKR